MDFNKELNHLIFKYNIDKHNPDYRSYIKAVDLAKQIFSVMKKSGRRFYLAGMDEADIRAFFSSVNSGDNCQYKLGEEVFHIEEGASVLFVSYYRKDEIVVKLLEKNVHVTGLYDFFEENGLNFCHNFYDIYHEQYYDYKKNEWVFEYGDIDINRIYFYHRRRYELENEKIQKRIYLEKMIFDCVYIKDFLTLKGNIDKYETEFEDEAERFQLFYRDAMKLLQNLAEALEKREKEDCIVFWLDALEYGMDTDMPFLRGLDDKALVFENIYTVTPYTSPTFLTILTGKKQIDDETYKITKISEEDSNFLQELKKRNYLFQYYGNTLNYLCEHSLRSSHFYRSDRYPITQIYWDVLTDITEADDTKNRFCILHEVSHTHNPFVSFGITGRDAYLPKEAFTKGHISQERFEKQQLQSRKYTDRQLEFWSGILPERMYKIYMSDHGISIMGRFHVILKIHQENVKPYSCGRLISYTDFASLILQVMDRNTVDEDTVGREYALIQEVARYNKALVYEIVSDREFYSVHPEIYLGFQGVVTEKDIFIRLENGMEYYQKHVNDQEMVTDNRLDYLRRLTSRKQADYLHEKKFQYTKILVAAEKRRTERAENIQKKKREIIKNIFCQIQDTEVLALRGGGYHTLNLLMSLSEQYRKKVKYIIDCNRQCVAGKMGIEVISLDEVLQKGITTVLLSTWQYLQKWEQEMQDYENIRIINIYRILENKGIVCDREACFEKFEKEDFELE